MTLQKGKITRTGILNAINEKYDLIGTEITSYEEASNFFSHYLAPIGTIAPNFFDRVDAEIGLVLMDYWRETDELNKLLIPLLERSTLFSIEEKSAEMNCSECGEELYSGNTSPASQSEGMCQTCHHAPLN